MIFLSVSAFGKRVRHSAFWVHFAAPAAATLFRLTNFVFGVNIIPKTNQAICSTEYPKGTMAHQPSADNKEKSLDWLPSCGAMGKRKNQDLGPDKLRKVF